MFRSYHPKTRSFWIFDSFGFRWLGAAVDAQLTRECEPGGNSLQVWDILVSHPRLLHGGSGRRVLRSLIKFLELLGSKLIVSGFDGVVRHGLRVRSCRGNG